jgi:hypothetical protein
MATPNYLNPFHVVTISFTINREVHLNLFLCTEGPRSRRYEHTAAWRLTVQFCDDDDDIIEVFSVFCILMEHRWNEIDKEKWKYSEKNLSQCHFVDQKSHMDHVSLPLTFARYRS